MEHFGDNKFLLKVMGQPVHRQVGIHIVTNAFYFLKIQFTWTYGLK